MSTKKQYNGISLRAIHALLVVGAVLLSGLVLLSTFYLSASFKKVTDNSARHIEMQNAALELTDASDYMTEKVQRFAIKGDLRLLDDYYNEAFMMQHREEAVAIMSSDADGAAALEKLKAAMDSSQELMEKEYYAIRLVVEAKGYTNYPLSLDDVTLTAEDSALGAEGKMNRAREIVFGDEYYAAKYIIHKNTQDSLEELEKLVNQADEAALEEMRESLIFVCVVVMVEIVGMCALVWLASRLGIYPIIKAVERIKNDSEIPEAGTTEFRYLVRAYNRMYAIYRKNLAQLNFKASHDELTGVYNRAGYESLMSSLELNSTYMLLFDVDNFKGINDTYGHETGDKVLVKLVKVLKNNFRPDDFICRIGGDEFVVMMLHSPQKQEKLIAEKIEKINRELNETEDGLPSASISVGIVHGSDAAQVEEMFKKTDLAMYRSKEKGKSTYTFYSQQQA